MYFSRRNVLRTAFAGAAIPILASCGPSDNADDVSLAKMDGRRPGATGEAPAQAASVLHILAHPDDDLYFMNPDLHESIKAGMPVTSVYLTAGEGTGVNVPYDAPDRLRTTGNRSAYAKARQNGLRAAYSHMATGDPAGRWEYEITTLAGGVAAESYALLPDRRVRLLFLNMVEAMNGLPESRGQNLYTLWTGRARTVRTVTPSGSGLPPGQGFSRDTLLTSIAGLFDTYRPTLVRTLDADPEHSTVDPRRGVRYRDHVDHYSSATFVAEALRHHVPKAGAVAPSILPYRTYSNTNWPATLGPAELARKKDFLVTYSGKGASSCNDQAGCGDRNIGDLKPTMGWIKSTRHRYPMDDSWAQKLPDGTSIAVGVIGREAVVWNRLAGSGNQWARPEPVGGGTLLSRINAVRQSDGRIRLFALAATATPAALSGHRRSVMTSVQKGPGGRFGTWEDLGNPAAHSDGMRGREVGVPTAVALPNGRARVFVRNWNRSVSTRAMVTDHSWGPWTVIGGREVQDGLTALVGKDGRLRLFAAGADTVWAWKSRAGAGPDLGAAEELPLTVPASRIAVAELPTGKMRLVYRRPGTGEVILHDEGHGKWLPMVSLGFVGGTGSLAVHPSTSGGGHWVSAAGADGRTALTHRPHGRPAPGAAAWRSSGPLIVGTPSLTTAPDGRTTVVVTGVDGALHSAVLPADGRLPADPVWSRAQDGTL